MGDIRLAMSSRTKHKGRHSVTLSPEECHKVDIQQQWYHKHKLVLLKVYKGIAIIYSVPAILKRPRILYCNSERNVISVQAVMINFRVVFKSNNNLKEDIHTKFTTLLNSTSRLGYSPPRFHTQLRHGDLLIEILAR